MAEITVARRQPEQTTRLRIVVGRKTGAGPLILEPPMTPADIAAHRAASHVRRPAPSAA
jgi:hypothetical protein